MPRTSGTEGNKKDTASNLKARVSSACQSQANGVESKWRCYLRNTVTDRVPSLRRVTARRLYTILLSELQQYDGLVRARYPIGQGILIVITD
jgi:hypothetical protein